MPFAVMGKILWVDLTHGEIYEETIADEIYQRFLSGIGLATYILYRDIPKGADPLGPENILAFVSGLLNGTNSFFTGRWMAAARSPLTGGWGEANCGGTLAPVIKRCGYDGIFFKGCSPKPVYLLISNGKAELRDAGALWGKDTVETDHWLRAAHPGIACACIGPAGERLSLISGISNDGGRMAARSGLGAVMGSKKLKAIAIQGNRKITTADKEQMQRLSRKAYRWLSFQAPLPPGKFIRYVGTLFRVLPLAIAQDGLLYQQLLRRWGTIGMNQISIEMGDSPIKNWAGSSADFPFAKSDSINPDLITRDETQKYRCRSCTLGCGGLVSNRIVPESHKPEYESVLALGGLSMNEDLESIYRINDRLNRAGMDTISAGSTAAFAIECAQNGLLPREIDGVELTWGSAAAVELLVDKMITREGIGDLLADGTRKAAEQIGRNAADFAVHAGGQELAMHDPRNDPGFALHAAVEASPGRHTYGSHLYYEMFQLWTRVPGLPKPKRLFKKETKYLPTADQAAAAVACSRFTQVMNGAGLCMFGAFTGVNRLPVFEWINAAAGWSLRPQEIMQIGARIQAVKQLFNARHGVPLRQTVNKRALGLPPQKDGANRGRSLALDQMIRDYWSASGYDPDTGLPTPAALEELGLSGDKGFIINS